MKIVKDGIEVEVSEEEALQHIQSENAGLRQKVTDMELRNQVETFTADALEKIMKAAEQRKMVFPAGEERIDGLTADELVLGKHIIDNRVARGLDSGYRLQEQLDAAIRTMTTGGTGTGAELLESPILAKLWEDFRVKTRIASLFDPIINMPGQTLDLPKGLGDVTFYKPAGQGQAVTATDLATAKRTLTAYPLKAQVDVSDELNQDAIIALLPQIRAALVRNGAEVMDKVVLLGDTEAGATGNINSDDAAPGGTEDYLIGFDGIVKYALITNSGQAVDIDTLAITDFGSLLLKLQKYAVDRERLAWICGWYTYVLAVTLGDFRTVDKLGAKATLLNGQLGAVYNIPYVVTGQMGLVDDDGKYTITSPATNDTDGRLILVNRDMWRVGIRKPLTIETERSAAKGVTSLIVTVRLALQSFDAAGVHTAIGYNINGLA